jgi:hypothetical protein
LGNDPKAVVLDLMEPARTARRLFSRAGKARFESDGTLDATLKLTERDGHAE